MNPSVPRRQGGSHRAGSGPGQVAGARAGSDEEQPDRRTGWARFLVPVVLILMWFVVGGFGGPYFGRISEVVDNNQSSYLPASSAATQVADLQAEFTDSDAVPAVIVYVNDAGLTDADRTYINGRVPALSGVSGVAGGVSPAQFSNDGKAAEIFVPVADNDDAATTVENLRTAVTEGLPAGLSGYVTGPAGQLADITEAFGGIDTSLLLVAVIAVFVILVVVYRSPLLPVLVLLTSVFALSAAILVVYYLARAGALAVNGQVQGILFILGIGAATDYSLLYVSRYRESLRDHPGRWDATLAALKGTFEPVLASAATVTAGLLCLLLSDLNSNKALGPVAAIGIGFAFLAAMTFLPALLMLTGRAAFWPRRPLYGSRHPDRDGDARNGIWPRVARTVKAHPRRVWVIPTVLLLLAVTGMLQLRASGVPQSDFVLGETSAKEGQQVLGEHFPSGSGSPVLIVAPEGDLDDVAGAVLGVSGVDTLTVQASGTPAGSLPVTADGVQPSPVPGAAAAPTVVDGKVLLEATLTDPPDSDAAEQTVDDMRGAVAGINDVLIGGETATTIDTNAAAIHDRNLIIPVVLVVILFLLMLLLRSILAPVLLILTVLLSFGATLGVSALMFNHVFDFPGADPAVPLFGFIFLVALGVDYNIFLMTRVREESLQHGTREGVIRGLMITGSVITSAGIVLAATFAALGVIPVLFLAQLAFIVAFGVLLDTLVVRSLLVPALSYDIGRSIWWPSRLSRPPRGLHRRGVPAHAGKDFAP
ncbi:MMPL family transporter [Arthrobacter jiangjiafuii]|uniref:MMPL family transporter n=1 Tax=Arthrobacter jiangjiafuii TaxID=2817475 RepID=A0A975M2V9_9MICC|nr:efflux RND transporter permease subunit [Arthrobacter jiangjiafuii]MBP3043428.1 MMPL family transporter [Arthrobacter jiangjiafuii]QWC08956.1 MMPL family transporter [Arthrobacter jiangjiafuii]